jgi:hypothetical protein
VERDNIEADLKDEDGRTPLSRAPEEGHEAVARLLVEQDDIEADSKDEDGMTALSLALEQGHEAVVRLLETKLSNWRVVASSPTFEGGQMAASVWMCLESAQIRRRCISCYDTSGVFGKG